MSQAQAALSSLLGLPRFLLPLLLLVAAASILALFTYFRRSPNGRQIIRDVTGADPVHEALEDLNDAQRSAEQALPAAEARLARAKAELNDLRRAAGLPESEE